MAGIAMTSDAVDRLAWLNQVFWELADHLTMAVLAVVQHDPRACLAHANRLMPILKSKRVRVAIAAIYLRCILADQVVWGVAVIARRDRAMAGFLPTGELLAHDVAVRAGRRVIRQIRRAPCVVERVSACPDQHPRQSKRKQHNEWPKVHTAPPCRCLRLLSSYAAPASKALAGWPVSALTFGIKKPGLRVPRLSLSVAQSRLWAWVVAWRCPDRGRIWAGFCAPAPSLWSAWR